jgi:hypothetical protein
MNIDIKRGMGGLTSWRYSDAVLITWRILLVVLIDIPRVT